MRMRGMGYAFPALLVLGGALMLGACGNKNSPDQYVGKCITELKEKDQALSDVMDAGAEESNGQYVIQFPEELREPYMDFLKQALNQVEFNVKSAEENGQGDYKVKVYFEPLDILDTTAAENTGYLAEPADDNLTDAVKSVLKSDKGLLEEGKKREEAYQTIKVKEKGDSYEISPESLTDLVEAALVDYMYPYNCVAETYDEKNFLQSFLDADLKGEMDEFIKYTGSTKEEALKVYEDGFISAAAEAEFPADIEQRYIDALKAIYKSCDYSVGIPKQTSSTGYVIEVTIKPNLSIANASEEFQNGTYYSEEEVQEAFVSIHEKYAASPVYGDETKTTVQWDVKTKMETITENSELGKLERTIIPIPE